MVFTLHTCLCGVCLPHQSPMSLSSEVTAVFILWERNTREGRNSSWGESWVGPPSAWAFTRRRGRGFLWALLGWPRLSCKHPGPCALLGQGLSQDLMPWDLCLVDFGAAGHPSGAVPSLKKEVTLHLPHLFIYGCGHGMAAPGRCGTSASSTWKAAGCGHVPLCWGLKVTVHPFLH